MSKDSTNFAHNVVNEVLGNFIDNKQWNKIVDRIIETKKITVERNIANELIRFGFTAGAFEAGMSLGPSVQKITASLLSCYAVIHKEAVKHHDTDMLTSLAAIRDTIKPVIDQHAKEILDKITDEAADKGISKQVLTSETPASRMIKEEFVMIGERAAQQQKDVFSFFFDSVRAGLIADVASDAPVHTMYEGLGRSIVTSYQSMYKRINESMQKLKRGDAKEIEEIIGSM